ncbi:DUF3800 domain-containing protein [Bacteroides caecimuris]|uniref:DUF3800 domain-containing protein n=1 Tax=Bacteroides caecimuris TaxID=1796613 RepID=UPI002647861E|nr:DUF3800 domain-containing protein [Bacteroides caecimuris]
MDQPKKAYSIFCDESCHLQFDNSDVMCIGAIIVPDALLDTCKHELKRIKSKYGILHELKWNTVSRTHLAMYDEILRLFFESPMTFRSVLIKNKSNIQAHSLGRDEYNRFYYSVIERLIRFSIRHNSDSANFYRIFLDLKDNHGKIKLASIHNELTRMIGTNDIIQSLQNIRSHESQFIQLADIIIGAITYRARGLSGSEAKIHIVKFIEELSGYQLDEGTEPGDDKFAIYDFQPKRRDG